VMNKIVLDIYKTWQKIQVG